MKLCHMHKLCFPSEATHTAEYLLGCNAKFLKYLKHWENGIWQGNYTYALNP